MPRGGYGQKKRIKMRKVVEEGNDEEEESEKKKGIDTYCLPLSL